MTENKFTGMRLSPEFTERIAVFEQRYGWTPGQTFVQLMDFYDRMKMATADFGQGVMNDGERITFLRYTHPVTNEPGSVNFLQGAEAEAALHWLVDQLGENMADAFREERPDFEEFEH